MRFSPVSGTMSAMVPRATRSSKGRRSKSAAPGQAGLASALEEGVGEFEGEAGGTEFGEGRGRSYMSHMGYMASA